jgi:hypothetical protein
MAALATGLLQQFPQLHDQLHAVQQQPFHCPSALHVSSLCPKKSQNNVHC